MSKKFLHKLILIFSGSALALSLFFGLFTGSANYFVINVNQAEDLALAKDAVVCDTNLIDFESTCSLRAAIEFAHLMKAQDPTIADYIIIKFEDLLTKGIDTIELTSKLPTIKIPIIIDGGNTDCANSNLKSKPRLTISGKGSYSYGFSFDSFYGTSQDSAHGSKVCNIALDGFNSGGISINGYWDYTNLVFKDAKLNTTYEFFNNYIGFDKSGLSFDSSSTSSGNFNISSTQGVLLKNNVIRSSISSYNSNSLDLIGNLIGVNVNAMPVSTYPATSISLTHNSNQDDGTIDNINIVENLFVNISSSANFNNLKFSDNIIGFSPYSDSGVQKFMNLTSSASPVYLYGSSIKNLTFTNNNVDFGSADSGYAFEPKPNYIDYLVSLPVVENMYFDNNKIGTQIGLPDSYYATALYFKSVYNSQILNSQIFTGNSSIKVYNDFANNTVKNILFKAKPDIYYSQYGFEQSTSGYNFSNNLFQNLQFYDYNKAFIKVTAKGSNNVYSNLTGDLEFSLNSSVSESSIFESNPAIPAPLAPKMTGYETIDGNIYINLSHEYQTSAEQCSYQFYIGNNINNEYFAKNLTLLTDKNTYKKDIQGTLTNGTCKIDTSLKVPNYYPWHTENSIFAQVTVTDSTGDTTSTFGAPRIFLANTSATITFNDFDSDTSDFRFPFESDVEFTAQNLQGVKSIYFDLDTAFDSDQDGDSANDKDIIANNLVLNFKNKTANNSSVDINFQPNQIHTLRVFTEGLTETSYLDFELFPFLPILSEEIPACLTLDSNSQAIFSSNLPLVSPGTDYVEFDFDSLTDSQDTNVKNSLDGISNNDVHSNDTKLNSLVYTTPGVKKLSVKMYDTAFQSQFSTAFKDISIFKAPENVMAQIETTVSDLSVQFSLNNLNACLSSVDWDFGDGTKKTGLLNQSHKYSIAGTYKVSATVLLNQNSFTFTKEINVGVVEPNALFEYTINNNKVSFENISTNLFDASFQWDFDNDGVIDSTEKNPMFEYSKPGTYQVNLTVENQVGSSVYTDQINIEAPVDLIYTTQDIENSIKEFETIYVDFDSKVLIEDKQSSQDGVWTISNPDLGILFEQSSLELIINSNQNLINNIQVDQLDKSLILDIKYASAHPFEVSFKLEYLRPEFSFLESCITEFQSAVVLSEVNQPVSHTWLIDDQIQDMFNDMDSVALFDLTAGNHNLAHRLSFNGVTTSFNQDFTVQPELDFPQVTIEVLSQSYLQTHVALELSANSNSSCLEFEWDFNNDGSIDSQSQTVSFDYLYDTNYKTILTVTNPLGQAIDTKEFYFKDPSAVVESQLDPVSEAETLSSSPESQPTTQETQTQETTTEQPTTQETQTQETTTQQPATQETQTQETTTQQPATQETQTQETTTQQPATQETQETQTQETTTQQPATQETQETQTQETTTQQPATQETQTQETTTQQPATQETQETQTQETTTQQPATQETQTQETTTQQPATQETQTQETTTQQPATQETQTQETTTQQPATQETQTQETTTEQPATQETQETQTQETIAEQPAPRRSRSSSVGNYTPPVKKLALVENNDAGSVTDYSNSESKTVQNVAYESSIVDSSEIQFTQSPEAIDKAEVLDSNPNTINPNTNSQDLNNIASRSTPTKLDALQEVTDVETQKLQQQATQELQQAAQNQIVQEQSTPQFASLNKTTSYANANSFTQYSQGSKTLEFNDSSLFLGFLKAEASVALDIDDNKKVQLESKLNQNKFEKTLAQDQLELALAKASSEQKLLLSQLNFEKQKIQKSEVTSDSLLDKNIQKRLGVTSAESDQSFLEQRSLYKAPEQVDSPILLELDPVSSFSFSNFVVNGHLNYSMPTPNLIYFYLRSNRTKSWELLGTTRSDKNRNFAFQNTQDLADGKYELLVETIALDAKELNSKVFQIHIDSKQPSLTQPKVNKDLILAQGNSLSLLDLSPNSVITINLQSVLYSAQAIVSSTQSKLEIKLPQISNFEPGSTHKLTVYAQSIDNSQLNSEPQVYTLKIPRQNQGLLNLFLISLPLITGLYFLRTRKGDQLTK